MAVLSRFLGFKKIPFSNMIKYIIVLEEGETTYLVPHKKQSPDARTI